MEVKGKIKVIGEAKEFGSNGFRKRDLVVVTEDQYPQYLSLEFHQDKCDLLNNYKQDDEVTVQVNLRGREWVNPEGETKYFNSIVGWRIEKSAASAPPSNIPDPSTVNVTPTPPAADADSKTDNEYDDLPF